ncbi:MAG: hypothetical protein FJW35_19005, partial [Acidobacteria bacterium]|nr:hypothetical protein [Acidobacteriota bacterium]
MKDTDLTDILREAEQLACEGRLTQAAMLYRTLLADEDGLSPQVRASALNDLAVISAAGGDGEAARVYLRQALGCFPHHAQAQRNLHDLAAVAEHRPRPQEIFDCLTNLYASDEKARSHMEAHLQRYAEILSALGREAEGLKLLELGADTYFFLLLHQRYIPQEGLDEIMSELDAKMPALEAPPLKPASGEPVAVVFPESALAHQYCLGRGLEIGGSA